MSVKIYIIVCVILQQGYKSGVNKIFTHIKPEFTPENMRKCTWCGKSGWFLSVSQDGFCQSCKSTVKNNIIQATQVLNQSLSLMKRAKELDFRLSKAEQAIEKLRELLPYYEKKLLRLNPSPQEWVAHIHSEMRKMVTAHVLALFETAIREAQQTLNASQRAQVFDKVSEAINMYEGHLSKANARQWRERVATEKELLINHIETISNKKGGKDRALGQYLETLAMLRAEYRGEPDQAREIKRVEQLIIKMGGEVPENKLAPPKDPSPNGSDQPNSRQPRIKMTINGEKA